MSINKFEALSFWIIFIAFSSCSSNSDTPPQKDTIKPTLVCLDPITVFSSANGAAVTYTTPVGTDNLPGAITTQTAGFKSGSIFPLGVTTNTFVVADVAGNTTSCSFTVTVSEPLDNEPYLLNKDNFTPTGKKWVKVENMSDEFNNADGILNSTKWQKTNATGWIGRSPGLFIDDAITISDGYLKITNSILPNPVVKSGATFTHGCGLVASKNAIVNGYFECKMKASKTFMSSTFWLINNQNAGAACDKRTIELDITENVGVNSGNQTWIDGMITKMNSNLHSRNVSCTTTPVASNGNGATLSGKAYEAYHVYGAWWKSKSEVVFYLDGKFAYTIVPPADFNLPMYLRMVTETYDWNPVPTGGGLTGTADERTTKYDWVRTWTLEDK